MSHLTDGYSLNNIQLGPEILAELTRYHGKILKALRASVVAFEHDNLEAAREVLEMGDELIEGMDKLRLERQSQILREVHTPQELTAFNFETEVMENFKRMYHHLRRVAKLVLHQEGVRTDLVIQ